MHICKFVNIIFAVHEMWYNIQQIKAFVSISNSFSPEFGNMNDLFFLLNSTHKAFVHIFWHT